MSLKLDIGCGGRGSMWPGFIGIDLHPPPQKPRKTDTEYRQLDFVHDKLPWERDSVDEAIAIHIVEHLAREEAVVLIQRAMNLLKPDARLTIAVPDLHKLCWMYLAEDEEFWDQRHTASAKPIWPGPTLADKLNWAIHQEGHRWSYDDVSLRRLVRDAGWGSVPTEPLTPASRYCTRPRHECGLILTKPRAA